MALETYKKLDKPSQKVNDTRVEGFLVHGQPLGREFSAGLRDQGQQEQRGRFFAFADRELVSVVLRHRVDPPGPGALILELQRRTGAVAPVKEDHDRHARFRHHGRVDGLDNRGAVHHGGRGPCALRVATVGGGAGSYGTSSRCKPRDESRQYDLAVQIDGGRVVEHPVLSRLLQRDRSLRGWDPVNPAHDRIASTNQHPMTMGTPYISTSYGMKGRCGAEKYGA